MSQPAANLETTPLNSVHRRMKAKMVDFGGWDMPVQYSGILEEHNAVRNAVGLFDVSHMGEIEVRGPEALNLVDYVSSNNASKLKNGPGALLGPACMSTAVSSTTSSFTRSTTTTSSSA